MTPSGSVRTLGLIAGKGLYPRLVLEEARKRPGIRVAVAAFEGETAPDIATAADAHQWLRVGQLGALLTFFRQVGVTHALMAGQITPKRLFDLRPDFKALLLLARLKKRNAETLFGAVADALAESGIELLPATTFLEDHLAPIGHIAGPAPSRHVQRDLEFGWPLAKQISAMDIGQTIVIKKGTVLAVEAYEGTNDALRRGGALGGGGATAIKVSKPRQDMRFDVPVLGPDTIRIAAESGVSALVCESQKTLLLDRSTLQRLAREHGVSVLGKQGDA
ncbi:MAG: UDP-2,3-diacylglucosamine diphosphatase LpxI [Candidatus Methylacidiphilales bacterium]